MEISKENLDFILEKVSNVIKSGLNQNKIKYEEEIKDQIISYKIINKYNHNLLINIEIIKYNEIRKRVQMVFRVFDKDIQIYTDRYSYILINPVIHKHEDGSVYEHQWKYDIDTEDEFLSDTFIVLVKFFMEHIEKYNKEEK